MSGCDSTNRMLINWCVAGPWHRHQSKLILSVKTSRRITGRDQYNMYCQHSNASGVHKNVKDNLSCPRCHVKQKREGIKSSILRKGLLPVSGGTTESWGSSVHKECGLPQLFPRSSKVRIFKFYLWLKRSRLLVSTRACGFQLWGVHKPLWG